MINIRTYANFFTQKCDCCKRVRKIKTKLEVVDKESNALFGEISLCPQCLQHFDENSLKENKVNASSYNLDDDDLEAEDYEKLGYKVQRL